MRQGAVATAMLVLLLVAAPAGAAGRPAAPTLAAGFEHACAIVGSDSVRCWGGNENGQLGNGQTSTFGAQTSSIEVADVGRHITGIAAGLGHTCAIVSSGAGVRCWGWNAFGQLGTGDETDSTRPREVAGLGAGVHGIVSGRTTVCVIAGGAAYCWGHNEEGELGNGQPGCDPQNLFRCHSNRPVRVAGLAGVVQLAVGDHHACALTGDGRVHCWGWNVVGELGTGGSTGRRETRPVTVAALGHKIVAISAGADHTCALNRSGAVACWGSNDSGQLGDGTLKDRHRPVIVIRSGVAEIVAADVHTCAITTKRGVACWGRNQWGELGDGTTHNRHRPVAVSGLGPGSEVTELDGGYQFTCAREFDYEILCWGKNQFGALADGTTTDRSRPVTARVICLGEAPTIVAQPGTRTVGTKGDDVILGTRGADEIDGVGGHDRICGSAGNDTLRLDGKGGQIDGGPGNDKIFGADGGDLLYGGTGKDTIRGGDGVDIIDGGGGNDTIDGGRDDDDLFGEDGVDALIGGRGRDMLSGGDDPDVLNGSEEDDDLNGGAGGDVILGGYGEDTIDGGDGQDNIAGGPNRDVLRGGDDDDHVSGGSGNDSVDGGRGDDFLFGGDGKDSVYGGRGDDHLEGGAQRDVLRGGPGTDRDIGGGNGDYCAGERFEGCATRVDPG